MLLPIMAACNADNTNDDSSAGESSDIQMGEYDDGADIDALYVTELPADREYVNILNGQAYTLNREPHEKYKGTENGLTDASASDVENNSAWSGFIGKSDIEITVDLGKSYDGLCGFSIDVMIDSPYGRGVPRSARLCVSDDGETFTKAVSCALYAMPMSNERSVYTIEGYTEKGFSARYVKLVLGDILVNWTFLDAFRVYTAKEKQPEPVVNNDYYKNEPMPEVNEDVYWDSGDADYKETVNLISKLPQRIYSLSPISNELRTDYYNVQPTTTALTDGKKGTFSYTDPSYAHFTGALGREIIYDIGKLSTVQYAAFSCMLEQSAGINVPEMIQIQLSEDGEEWQTVASVKSSDIITSGGGAYVKIPFNAAYKARFVKFTLRIGGHCWVDELEVFGTKEVNSLSKELEGPSASISDDLYINKYPSLDVLGGSENIYLAYNYKVEDRPAGLRSKEQYKPLVGYYDKDGKVQDFFFDSFLYLPCSTVCPSGGKLWEDAANPSFMSDWLDYEKDLYADGYNIKALNEAVGEVKQELGKSDYQAYVYFSIFNLSPAQRNFGDIDGDGITEDASKMSDRKKIAKWWIDRNIDNFKNGGFDNLKLNGFYWYDESIGLGDADKREIVNYIVDYVHSLGYYIIWIPYFQASGFMSWKSAGFDCANMQPNYMFSDDAGEDRLYENAELAEMYGMGVEIEADGRVFSSDSDRYDRYMAYLRVGVEKGYMNTIKMYYCDAVPGVFLSAYNSKDAKHHAVYDMTYLYAKRKLTVDSGASSIGGEPITVKVNEVYKGELSITSAFSSVSVKYGARHGLFALNSTGKFKYTPDENFVGEDSVVLLVSAGETKTEVTLKITVKKE